jgi:hypothetical protein
LAPRRNLLALAALLALVGVACAHRDWRRALEQDTTAAYYQFLREHPGDDHAPEARARIDLVRLRARPTLEGFHAFSQKFGDTGLVDELRPHVESLFFDQARRIGTPEAYESFLADFPGGALAARATGNADFLRNHGFGGDLAQLADFAARHPESDFAAEAVRSASSLRQRTQQAFDRTRLVVDVDPTTPGADRLRRVFEERAVERFRAAGRVLVPAADSSAKGFDSVLRIAHREGASRADLKQGAMTQSGLLAETEVTLQRSGDDTPIWQDTFTYLAPLSSRKADESILFQTEAVGAYWTRFFVPVASWQTRGALRNERELAEPPVAVDAADGRAVVLFADGSFQLLDIADPASPAILAEYRRARDLARFEGVALIGDRVAVFGSDGLEIVAVDGSGARRERVWPREKIGSLTAVVPMRTGLALAGNRGLSWIPNDASDPKVLVPKGVFGLERAGDHLLFTDGATLYAATPAQLAAGRVASELRFGSGFELRSMRLNGSRAIAIGARGVVVVDVADPNHLAARSRLEASQIGEVRDALAVSGQVFLLGDRGLQVVDRAGERVAESLDVSARQHLAVGGRHLVLIGGRTLSVVDSTPFVASVPAAPRGAGKY